MKKQSIPPTRFKLNFIKVHGAFLVVFALQFLLNAFNLYAETLCAEVKIEIRQEMTLERQAFDAHMRIKNGFNNISLNNIRVDVYFTDEDNNPVLASSDPDNTEASFFMKINSMENISDVSGSGTVGAATTADIHWLIIPAPGASDANPKGKLYYVGADLFYTINGEQHEVKVIPDYIFVKPMPELTLDYFLPYDVYGDDAFTPEIEPSIPFSLGVRVQNQGFGPANKLKIESAQPKIVENTQGLLVSFVIKGSEVQGEPASNSLLVDFGNIESNSSKVARWEMISSLSGRFVDFNAKYTHSDALGGQMTSLIEVIKTHTLIQNVIVDLPGRDIIRDFLARDGQSPAFVYNVYESDNLTFPVDNQSNDFVIQSVSENGPEATCSLTGPSGNGFMFVQLQDPYQGQKVIKAAVRSDGKIVNASNIWLSKTRPNPPQWDYYVNMFDINSTGEYTIIYTDPSQIPQTPVLTVSANASGAETEDFILNLSATDPNNTIPVLSSLLLPVGASFTDNGDGTGVLAWRPEIGQSGIYTVAFKASDGKLSDIKRCRIRINSYLDKDGDGMADEWELQNFGTLERDGAGDYDGDGLTDLEEYLAATNPGSGSAPTIPEIDFPLPGAEVTTLEPWLQVINSIDPDGDPIQYYYEVYSNEYMVEPVISGTVESDSANSTTSWNVPLTLNDNSMYYWRVRSTDGHAYSQWSYGGFFVNTQNDAPYTFRVSMPVNNSKVEVNTPLLEVNNSRDLDRDILSYQFFLYDNQSQLLIDSPMIMEGKNGITFWRVNIPLINGNTYQWKTIVTDEHGLATELPFNSFIVDTSNHAPESSAILAPLPGAEVPSQTIDLIVQNVPNPDSEGDIVLYEFEIDKVQTFDSPSFQTSGSISEGTGQTKWSVSNLDDNTQYYWRVKTNDAITHSDWNYGSFFVNLENDLPSIPTIRNPGNHPSLVETLTPVLEVNPSWDPDRDDLTYIFEIYSDPEIQNLVAFGESSIPKWQVPVELIDWQYYYWRVRVRDSKGSLSGWTRVAGFYLRADKINDAPQINILEPSGSICTNSGNISIKWEDTDPDSNASISFYYTQEQNTPGTLIASGILEDEEGGADSLSWNTSGLSDGTYYIYAQISDEENTVETYANSAIIIDRTAPSIQIDPIGGQYVDSQTVTLSTNETETSIYFTSDGTEPDIRSIQYGIPFEINQSSTLKITAFDKAGNQTPVITQNYTIGVDTRLTFIEKPENWTTEISPFWSWTVPEWIPNFEGYAVTIDANPEVLVSQPQYTASSLTESRHEITVRVKYMGLYGEPLSQAFTVDITNPVLEQVMINNGAIATADPLVSIDIVHDNDNGGSGIAKVMVNVDNQGYAELTGGQITLPASIGKHTVSVKLVDRVGLESEELSDDIFLAQSVAAILGTSLDATQVHLKDLNGSLTITQQVTEGAFRFDNIPQGTYGLYAENQLAIKPYRGRISLYDQEINAGDITIGAEYGEIGGVIFPGIEGISVLLGLNTGQGMTLELQETLTEAGGTFAFPGIVPGIYKVIVIPSVENGLAVTSQIAELEGTSGTQLNIALQSGAGLSGVSTIPDFRLNVWNNDYQSDSILTSMSGTYSILLTEGAYTMFGRNSTLLYGPQGIDLTAAGLILDITPQEKMFNINATINNTNLILSGANEPQTVKFIRFYPKNRTLPFIDPCSQEIKASGTTINFQIDNDDAQGDTLKPCVSLSDYSNDIHSTNDISYIYNSNFNYTVAQAGASINGVVTNNGQPSVKPYVFLYNSFDMFTGYCEGGINGEFFFRHIPPGSYRIRAIIPFINDEVILDGIILSDEEVVSGISINIGDITPPVIVAPAEVTAEAVSMAGTPVTISVTVTDDIDQNPVLTSNAPDLYPLGETIVTFTARDSAGNESTKQVKVTIKDTIPPVFDILPVDISGEATALKTLVNLGVPQASDIFPVTISNNAPTDGFDLGETTVTWTATDQAGNETIANQTITITDTTPPAITSPADITIEATGITTPVNTGTPAVTDIFPITISNDAPASFALGETIITWSAVDSSQNSATATQKITVRDTTGPVLTLPSDIEVEASGVTTEVNIGVASATDIFGPVTITNDAPAQFSLGTTAVSWTATDKNQNTTTMVQNIIVKDTTPPILSIPPDSVFEATGILSTVYIGNAESFDVFGATVSNNAPEAFSLGETTVIWTAIDSNQNAISKQQKVSIVDTTSPLLTLPPDQTVEATGANTFVDIGQASATDIFSVTVSSDLDTVVQNSEFPLGVTDITWTALDENGNSISKVQNITVQDTISPVLQIPADITAEATGDYTLVDLGEATATDLFGPVIVTNDAPSEGFPVGNNTVTWTATDANGNVSTASQNVNITTQSEMIEVSVRLVESNGSPIEGGSAKYAGSSWQSIGVTDSSGIVKIQLPLNTTNITVRMTYGGISKDITQNVQTNPVFTFQTVNTVVHFNDSTGQGIQDGVIKYAGSSWQEFGTTSVNGEASKELLPGNYTFRLTYGGASKDQSQNTGTNPNIEFQTVKATVTLKDSEGGALSGAVVKYAGSSWQSFGTTDETGSTFKELLPVTYTFRLTYGGASKDQSQNIGTNPNIEFQTVKAIVTLKDSEGGALSGAVVKYAGSSWQSFGTTDESGSTFKELLPVTYTFRLTYGGASKDQSQNIGTNPSIEFQTVKATVTLKDSEEGALSGAVVKYAGSSWQDFGTTDESGKVFKELLPVIYTFRLTYGGASNDKSQHIGTNPNIEFQTVKAKVTLKDSEEGALSGALVKYAGSSWQDFGTTDESGNSFKELLPATYTFRLTYGGASKDRSQHIGTNPDVEFQTMKVTVVFKDNAGTGIPGALVKYAGSSWQLIGTTDETGSIFKELLPVTYTFRLSYSGSSTDITSDINTNSVIEFIES